MEYYLLLARSVTHAQRLEDALARGGIVVQSFRAPAGLTERGCAYALRLRPERFPRAMRILNDAGQSPYQIFLERGGEVREVVL